MRLRSIGLVVLTATAGAAAPAAGGVPVSVAIREADDGYVVEGVFDVSAPTPVVWAVLTDYERMGDFVKSVKRSVIVERTSDRIVLEQDGVAKVLVFSRRAHVVLWVTEDEPRTIRFRDVCARDFKTYEGRWDLEPRPGGVRVSYSLSAALKSKNPAFLVRGGMQGSTRALLEQMRAEIGRRSRRRASAPMLASEINRQESPLPSPR